MATDSISVPLKSAAAVGDDAGAISVWQSVKSILKPLASLRITVWLFALSASLVLIGTLALDKQGMWEVVDSYFRTSLAWPNFGFAWVDTMTFFPRKWFPTMEQQAANWLVGGGMLSAAIIACIFAWTLIRSRTRRIVNVAVIGGVAAVWSVLCVVQDGFFFPGGLLIGGALMANLTAAHTVRFTIQTRGLRLASGLIIIVLGIAVGVSIVLNGHNEDGLRGEPPFSWMTLWWIVKLSLTAGWAGCLVPAAILCGKLFQKRQRDSKSTASLVLSATGALILTAVMIFLWIVSPDFWLGEAAIRVLWQLLQGSIAALILMVGCVLAFKKRGGIVLLHAGVGLLMFNELFVGYHAVEEQIMIEEGKSANYAFSDQDLEIAVVTTAASAPDENLVVAVPIARNGQLSGLARDGVVQHEALPFDLAVVEFFRNSKLVETTSDKKHTATKSLDGRLYSIKRLPPAAGADSGSNLASAYVRLTEKDSDKVIGTYALSQQLTDGQRHSLRNEIPEVVRLGGKAYEVALRFQRVYKPYSIYLRDVQKVDYLGTSTPRDFSSYITFNDKQRNTQLDHRIWMNNPMRYAGWTYYQTSYDGSQGNEYTVLQVVQNRGWMIPYLACMIVVVGLAVHFVMTLGRFLSRLSSSSKRPGAATGESAGETAGGMPAWVLWGIPMAVVALTAVYIARKSVPPQTAAGTMNIHEFGKLPVVFRGRAKPMDSLARDSLRVLSNRATFIDADGEKQPAIVWLADVIAGKEVAEKHEVFRITNLELLDAMDLERKKGYLYSLSAIQPKIKYLSTQAQEAHAVTREGGVLTGFQEHVVDLEKKLGRYQALQGGFLLPPQESSDRLLRMGQVAGMVAKIDDTQVPLAVPRRSGESGQRSKEKAWQPLTSRYMDVWLHDLAKELDASSGREVAQKLAIEFVQDKNGYFREHIDDFAADFLRENSSTFFPGIPAEELDQAIGRQLKSLSDEGRALLFSRLGTIKAAEFAANVTRSLDQAGYDSKNIKTPNPAARTLGNILMAYRDRDIEAFNTGVGEYDRMLSEDYNVYDQDAKRVKLEAFFNHSDWLLNSWILYIATFVLVSLSWAVAPLGWFRPVSRTALAMLIFVFALHTGSLVLRIIISGRPPVTNLYSSAVFIGWGGVLIGLIVEAVFRGGLGTLVACVAGIANIAIAIFGLGNDGDTMGVMQAVLDTQFWLATHVVCITMGYATTFLAGKIGILYVVLGLFTPALNIKVRNQWTLGQVLTKLIYGIACFALFFSFFGTVLGGLWGDESWGRFWGWDPKENGALIIVLWNALLLHARWGGIVKQRGLAVLAIGGNIVTAWSWFGVNQLGIGLHSYGFTEGVLKMLGFFVISQFALIVVGMLPLSLWRSFEDQDDTDGGKKVIKAKLA